MQAAEEERLDEAQGYLKRVEIICSLGCGSNMFKLTFFDHMALLLRGRWLFFAFPSPGLEIWAAVGSVLIGHRSGPAAKATNSAPASWHRAGHSHHLRGQIVKKPFDKRHHCTMDNLCSTVDFLGLDWGDSCKVASCCFMETKLHTGCTWLGTHTLQISTVSAIGSKVEGIADVVAGSF